MSPGKRPRWGRVDWATITALVPDWKAITVYVALCAHADTAGVAWPLQSTLAHELQVSEATVRRALRVLETSGAISTRKRGRGRTEYVVAALV